MSTKPKPNRGNVGLTIERICTEAAQEHKGKTRDAFVVLGRAIRAQGAHVGPAWIDTFERIMRGDHGGH